MGYVPRERSNLPTIEQLSRTGLVIDVLTAFCWALWISSVVLLVTHVRP